MPQAFPTSRMEIAGIPVAELAGRFGTPTFVYDAATIVRRIDDLRAIEYSRLDSQGHVYLDYTGGGLYSDLQIRKHMNELGVKTFSIVSIMGIILGGKLGGYLGTMAKPLVVKILFFIIMLYLAFKLSSQTLAGLL